MMNSNIFDAVLLIAVLSLLLERSLSMVFEHPIYQRSLGKISGWKEGIALLSAFGICRLCKFDAYSMMFAGEGKGIFGYGLTALAIAGGSKGSLKLFRDVLGVGRESASLNSENRQ